MTAYYYGDQPKLTDEEFSLLKEELIWNGSKVRRPVRQPAALVPAHATNTCLQTHAANTCRLDGCRRGGLV